MVEKIAEANQLELVNDRRFSNTGTMRIERPDSFNAVVSFHYSFQDSYVSFSEMKPLSLGLPHIRETYGRGEQPAVKVHELEARILTPIRQYLESIP